MKLRLDRALRLLHTHLDRLGPAHQRQLVAAIAPRADLERLSADIETGQEDDEGDAFGLVYLRLSDADDAQRAWDGWFLDHARWPETQTRLEGGCLFAADTTDSPALSMSQSTWDAGSDPALRTAFEALGPIGVALAPLQGATGLPFAPDAPARAPARKKKATGPSLDLESVGAVRYTEYSARAAPEPMRFQLLHGLRPRFATPTPEGMEGSFALGMLYTTIDPGSVPGFGHRHGLIHARFRDRQSGECFDGWFLDRNLDASAYWPSGTATLSEGRVFRAGTIDFTGVSLHPSRGVTIEKKRALPIAPALAAGLDALGRTVAVTLADPVHDGAKGYFGTDTHARQVAEVEAFERAEAEARAARKRDA